MPLSVWLTIAAGALAIRIVVPVAMYRSALAAGLDRRTARKVAAGVAVGLVAWLAGAALLASLGAYKAGPGVLLTLIVSLTGLLLTARIPVMRKALTAPGVTSRLAWPHTVRWVGGVFLIAWALGKLSPVFAVPAALGDMATAAAAPFAARAAARASGRRAAVWFNAFGLLDEVIAIGTGVLVGSGAFHFAPSTDLGLLPLVVIPTTGVPLNAAMSILSLRRLTGTADVTSVEGGLAQGSLRVAGP